MFDYPALQALAAVIRLGSFERAAQALHVTPSAVSQRVKQLEERWGAVLVVRGQPCIATEAGRRLCRHVEQVGLLEAGLQRHLPGDAVAPLTLPIAVNADSLGTWFIEAAAGFAAVSGHLLDLAVDDQDHTAERLRRGEVLAAVTGHGQGVQGCRVTALGSLPYRATASPAFMARHFPDGVDAEAMARAPALTFDRKDQLQRQWLALHLGLGEAGPTHWLPSTQGFVDACLAGMGWALNPLPLVGDHLATGRLVEVLPGRGLETPLFWQIGQLAAKPLAGLTRAVVMAARRHLVRGP